MTIEDKVIEIFCITDEYCKKLHPNSRKKLLLEDKGHRHTDTGIG